MVNAGNVRVRLEKTVYAESKTRKIRKNIMSSKTPELFTNGRYKGRNKAHHDNDEQDMETSEGRANIGLKGSPRRAFQNTRYINTIATWRFPCHKRNPQLHS